MDTTTSFCVSNSLPASALLEPRKTNRSWTIGCKAGMAEEEGKNVVTSVSYPHLITFILVVMMLVPILCNWLVIMCRNVAGKIKEYISVEKNIV